MASLRVRDNVRALLNWKPSYDRIIEAMVCELVSDDSYTKEFNLKRNVKTEADCVNQSRFPDWLPKMYEHDLELVANNSNYVTTLSYQSGDYKLKWVFKEYFKPAHSGHMNVLLEVTQGKRKASMYFNARALDIPSPMEVDLPELDKIVFDYVRYVLNTPKDGVLDLNHESYHRLYQAVCDDFDLFFFYNFTSIISEDKEKRFVEIVPGSEFSVVPARYEEHEKMKHYIRVVIDAMEEMFPEERFNRTYYTRSVDPSESQELHHNSGSRRHIVNVLFRDGLYSLRLGHVGGSRLLVETLNDMTEEDIRQYVLDYFNN